MLRQNCSVNYLKLTLKKRLSILYIFATILDKLVYLNLVLKFFTRLFCYFGTSFDLFHFPTYEVFELSL